MPAVFSVTASASASFAANGSPASSGAAINAATPRRGAMATPLLGVGVGVGKRMASTGALPKRTHSAETQPVPTPETVT